MVKLTVELADKIAAACRAHAGDAGAALSAALSGKIELSAGDAATLSPDALPPALRGPGLVVLLHVDAQAALLAIPLATGLVPEWYAQPDATQTSQLQTLAHELSRLLLPASVSCDRFAAMAVSDMALALRVGELTKPAGYVKLAARSPAHQGDMHLVWPLRDPSRIVPASANEPAPAMDGIPEVPPPTPRPVYAGDALEKLPSYSRSLLSINVPLVVTLAATKKKVREIVQLGPGSIIQFEKSCEEMLDLEAGGIQLAAGEAVKVGDKFGLRITSIRLPNERLLPVGTGVSPVPAARTNVAIVDGLKWNGTSRVRCKRDACTYAAFLFVCAAPMR